MNERRENNKEIDLEEWAYELPSKLIARHPTSQRDESKLLHIEKVTGRFNEKIFHNIVDYLREGDLLVGNDTRVMAARVFATRRTGGAVELLILDPGPGKVRALAKPARRLKDGEILTLDRGGHATVNRPTGVDHILVEFDRPPSEVMSQQGQMPLPPYLERAAEASDLVRYQTVYSGPLGAVAAPTAGLHFTPTLLKALKNKGIQFAKVTLHVGIGTFRPVRQEDIDKGSLHTERYIVPQATVEAIKATRARGGRVIAVGTTATRALESATLAGKRCPTASEGETTLFIRPPHTFRCIDGLITNFHLPRSSLLMLVASLIGKDRLFEAYEHAIRSDYRFYSYGDAMLIL